MTDGDGTFTELPAVPTRPVRTLARGKTQELSADDKRWLKHAEEHKIPIRFELRNPKRKGSASYYRYNKYKLATTISQMYELTEKKSRSRITADLKYDYSKGFITFPEHEPDDSDHYTARANSATRGPYHPTFHDTISSAFEDDDEQMTEEHREAMANLKAFAAKHAMELMRQQPPGDGPAEPTTYQEAIASPQAKLWLASMKKEYDALIETGTFVLVPRAAHQGRPIGSKWVYRIKRDKDGAIAKFKSRLVAKGFSEILGQSYMSDEVYAPVVSYDSLRTMLSIANQRGWDLHQSDVSNAYLQSYLPRPQYMTQPKGFERTAQRASPWYASYSAACTAPSRAGTTGTARSPSS